jgi:cardiolipin synthase
MTFTVANILTLARLILTPFFALAFVLGRPELALILFCVAGFTDLIDGSVARWLNQPSKGGAILDPMADKLLMQSCFFLLMIVNLLPLWFFLLAFARDATIVAGIIYLERRKAELPYRPLLISKAATLLQLAVAILGLLRWWRPGLVLAGVDLLSWHFWAIALAAALIVVSGLQYVRMGFDILRRDAVRRARP